MDKSMSDSVEQVFKNLDTWRHLPDYRLEGRVAPFFALFLRDVLGEALGVELHEILIPEFPLRIGTLRKASSDSGPIGANASNKEKASDGQSKNVDYVAFSRDGSTAYLVELKTDLGSVNPGQQRYLRRASKAGMEELVGGIIQLCGNSKKRRKYVHLLHLLAKLNLVSISDVEGLYGLTFDVPRSGWTKAFNANVSSGDRDWPTCQVVYVQPTPKKPLECFTYIYFDDVARIVGKRGELGRVFARYLETWKCPAGNRDPREAD